ncbi:MAG: hypothetical protein LBF66_00120 [Holosporales bacterium]|nr:hypothetical protein [Holosporales bacterium]
MKKLVEIHKESYALHSIDYRSHYPDLIREVMDDQQWRAFANRRLYAEQSCFSRIFCPAN